MRAAEKTERAGRCREVSRMLRAALAAEDHALHRLSRSWGVSPQRVGQVLGEDGSVTRALVRLLGMPRPVLVRVVRWLAGQLGMELVPQSEAYRAVLKLVSAKTRTGADVDVAIAESVDDGSISMAEACRIRAAVLADNEIDAEILALCDAVERDGVMGVGP